MAFGSVGFAVGVLITFLFCRYNLRQDKVADMRPSVLIVL